MEQGIVTEHNGPGSNPPAGIDSANFYDSHAFSSALQRVDLEVSQTGKGAFRTLASFATGQCEVQIGSNQSTHRCTRSHTARAFWFSHRVGARA